jgi:hypothetical protein
MSIKNQNETLSHKILRLATDFDTHLIAEICHLLNKKNDELLGELADQKIINEHNTLLFHIITKGEYEGYTNEQLGKESRKTMEAKATAPTSIDLKTCAEKKLDERINNLNKDIDILNKPDFKQFLYLTLVAVIQTLPEDQLKKVCTFVEELIGWSDSKEDK